jgi:hypothetical protein
MKGKASSAVGVYWPIIPKWEDTPNLSHVNRKAAIGEVGVDRRSPIW